MKKIFQKKLSTKRHYSEAQKRQDEIFRKMPAEKKLDYALNFRDLL